MTRKLTAIDLFAGAGGLSEGFRQAGFDIVAANDFDEFSEQTFKSGHPDAEFISGPIQDVQVNDFLVAGGIKQGELDVLLGGPPCQAFSVYNHRRGMHDERSGLFREYLKFVEGLMPRFVVMENVTGIKSVEGGAAVSEIESSLRRLGYVVESRVLKAEDYGVPQERRRIFFVASRVNDSVTWPAQTHGIRDDGPLFSSDLLPFVTVEDAIGDLPALEILQGAEEANYTRPAASAYQVLMRADSYTLTNHVAPFLGDINLERLKHIPKGGSWRDIPYDLLPAGMKKAKRSDHTKRYGRLHPNGLASTILTKCDLHWGAYIHPYQQRTITVREAARFQSFPDRIRFSGPRGEQFRQVGNAVPPRLGNAVARAVLSMDSIAAAKETSGIV